MPGVELASLVNLTDPNFWNSYILFSGNILIENNNFAEIASCPSVDSGLLAISVATVSTEPNL